MTTADDRRKAAATASTYDQGNIKGLDDATTRRLVASTVLTESHGGDLAVTNKQGYVGRYQAGASWLVEAGYVDRDKYNTAFKASGYKSEWDWAVSGGMTKFLERDSNWNNGLDLDKYKASADLQDKAFKTNSDKLYDRAVKNGLLDGDDSPEKIAGFLKASHIGGYGAGRNVLQGKSVKSDANGTSPYDYYNDIVKDHDGLNKHMGRGGQGQAAGASSQTNTPSAGADGQLKRGEEGAEVVALQKRLNALGYGRPDGDPLVANGTFGPNTEAAVIKFQKEHGLEGLGVVGPKTMAALAAAEKGQTQSTPATPQQSNPQPTSNAPASHAIYNEAYQHFLAGGNKYEYGRGDMSLTNKEGNSKTDRSRTEQDLDGDGLKGVDCSSFVWRGLKNAGYDVGNTPFSTHALFNGNQITDYSKKNFDVIPAAQAKQANGSLQPGDVILFKDKDSSGQHVGIFKGYDDKGNIQFIGSQVSTGPAQANAGPGSYWNGKDFEIVGALRAKPEFQVRQPLNGTPDLADANPAKPTTTKAEAAGADGQLKRGEEGPEVVRLQDRLNNLGYGRADGAALVENGKFGPNTEAAVIKFQKEHGLEGLGVVGPKTLAALDAAEKAQSQGQGGQTTGKAGMALNAAHDMSIKYDDVKYGFGSKNLASGKVDCSGWVSQMQNATMEEINQKAGKTVFSGKDFFDKNNQAAADIIKDSVQTTGTLMRSPLDKSQLKEGMIIGEDNGQKGWDKGRYNGIDHITMVVKDPKTGQLMVSQSRGGEGVELTTLDKYLERKQANGVELFATDPLAKARPLIEAQQTTQTKSADAQTTAAIEKQQAPLLSNASHPDHGLYQQAMKGLEQMPAGAFKSAQERENVAAAIAFEAKVSGINQIDHVKPLGNGPGMFVVQGALEDPSHKRIYVDQQHVADQSVQKSSELAQQVQTVRNDTQPKQDQQGRAFA